MMLPAAPMPSGRPVKRSLTLAGHATSVSLEDAFWQAFRSIAAREGLTLNGLATRIDAARGDTGLASAIRVFVLADALAAAVPPTADPARPDPDRPGTA
jgi:predicted DNA-binding ribbon-helix-helix protein